MRRPFLVGRLLSVAAAYVVALQLVLLPLAISVGPTQAGTLCSERAGKADPVQTDPGCSCAAGCGVQCHAPGYPPAAVTGARLEPNSAGVLGPAHALAPVVLPHKRGAHAPRAPPVA